MPWIIRLVLQDREEEFSFHAADDPAPEITQDPTTGVVTALTYTPLDKGVRMTNVQFSKIVASRIEIYTPVEEVEVKP